jgi:hypothetical protein
MPWFADRNLMPEDQNSTLESSLLRDLACPVCHGELRPASDTLICASCDLSYPIRDGILVLIAERAQTRLR